MLCCAVLNFRDAIKVLGGRMDGDGSIHEAGTTARGFQMSMSNCRSWAEFGAGQAGQAGQEQPSTEGRRAACDAIDL